MRAFDIIIPFQKILSAFFNVVDGVREKRAGFHQKVTMLGSLFE